MNPSDFTRTSAEWRAWLIRFGLAPKPLGDSHDEWRRLNRETDK